MYVFIQGKGHTIAASFPANRQLWKKARKEYKSRAMDTDAYKQQAVPPPPMTEACSGRKNFFYTLLK